MQCNTHGSNSSEHVTIAFMLFDAPVSSSAADRLHVHVAQQSYAGSCITHSLVAAAAAHAVRRCQHSAPARLRAALSAFPAQLLQGLPRQHLQLQLEFEMHLSKHMFHMYQLNVHTKQSQRTCSPVGT